MLSWLCTYRETTLFNMCFDDIPYARQWPELENGLSPFLQSLMASKRKLKILIYNGDLDLVCNYFGVQRFVDNLNATVLSDTKPWFLNKTIGGDIKIYDGITLMTVRNSGHFVPTDKPAEALHMFEMYLLGLNQTR